MRRYALLGGAYALIGVVDFLRKGQARNALLFWIVVTPILAVFAWLIELLISAYRQRSKS